MNEPIDQIKRDEEAKRNAHWSPEDRWRMLQEAMTYAASLPGIDRNTPERCLELQAAKLRPPRLPEMLRPLFWDCDFAQVTWAEHREFVIRRVLSEGSWDAVSWLRRRIGDTALREWIMCHQGRWLDRQQLRFWELILDLPPGLVDSWLASEMRQLWEGRTGR
jgi:hypothetical protein